jgi:hypothetical protein
MAGVLDVVGVLMVRDERPGGFPVRGGLGAQSIY